MIWLWVGFFTLVAVLLALDLGVFNRKAKEPTLRSAAYWSAGWIGLGMSFSGVTYLIYENGLFGATVAGTPAGGHGAEAAITYISAYLLEKALSVDNIFVISLLFTSFRIPAKYQHRILFWGILGAIVFRLIMIGGGAYLAKQFSWVFYIFGGYLVWQGLKLFKSDEEEQAEHDKGLAVRFLRKFVRIVDGDHGGKFTVKVDGKTALTTAAVCLVSIELTDIVFALDSIPAVLSISQETYIMVTSNIFAIMGLRALYFVLAGAMAQFRYLKVALAVLLVFIGLKMIFHVSGVVHVDHVVSLIIIAAILTVGVGLSIIATRRERKAAAHEASATEFPTADPAASSASQPPVDEAPPSP